MAPDFQLQVNAFTNAPRSPMASPKQSHQELSGVFVREHWRPQGAPANGNLFLIGSLEDGTSIMGEAEPGELCPGMTYRFFGTFEESRTAKNGRQYGNGKTFKFKQFSKCEPHSRNGVVQYLSRHCDGIGPGIAGQLFDRFGSDACRTLRVDPDLAAAKCPRLSLGKAREAAKVLRELAATEDTRIELVNLLGGRGFPWWLIRQVIHKWGIFAPMKIRRDPFVLLLNDFPGVGFLRCDRLYGDLGLNPRKLRRQAICLWNAIHTDPNGHTWFPAVELSRKLTASIAGAAPSVERALKLGEKLGLLAVHRDKAGKFWIATKTAAENERAIADAVQRLMAPPIVLPRFTEAVSPDAVCGDGVAFLWEPFVAAKFPENVNSKLTDHEFRELARIGRELGICQFCGRSLTNEISRAHGYGPICAERRGLPYSEEMQHV